uniref:Replication-associated protein n=1 Tax=Giant panda feces-associated gemycircularvirus TaxID=2864014 RepID=A0A8K1M4S8_9VIRU|nr:replication-associated protein [Giant panda feces-associated gemycircularvirus]
MVRRFKLDSVNYVLLTYPTVGNDWPYQTLIDIIIGTGAVYRLGRELHKDGQPHYHCFVQWSEPFSHADAAGLFTVGGCRPNIKRFSANPGRRWDYVGKYAGQKEGHTILGDQCERPGGDKDDTERTQADIWGEIICSTSQDEFFEKLAALAPKQLGCNFGSLKLYAEWKYRPEAKVYETPEGILICLRPKGLVLFGATRLGKTVWARSLGPHSYFGGLFNLDEYSESTDYAVFDDINGGLAYFPSYKQWLGGQFDFTVNDKYKHKRTVRFGKPSIYICNEDPREVWYKPGTRPDFAWMEENCVFVEATETIFHASTE